MPPGGQLNACFAADATKGRAQARVRLTLAAAIVLVAVFGDLRPAYGDLVVPANSLANLGSGAVDLGCTDVIVAGTLQLGSGSIVNARHVTIQAGGTIDGGTGILTLGGDWANAGQFIPGAGTVRFRDACSLPSATISGNSIFSTASFVTANGKGYVFGVGSTQVINGRLEIAGTAGLPIQFRSSAAGQVAFIDLLTAGVQEIQHVGVTDVWATGQWLAPTLTNEGGGGNAKRWFGNGVPPPSAVTPVPALSGDMQALMAALVAAAGAWFLRRPRPTFRNFNRPRR